MAVNRADKFTATTKKTEIYSDFGTNFDVHPETKQLLRVVNENAVKRSIRNLVLTNRYDRYKNPRLGGNINRLLFEPATPQTQNGIQTSIEEVITNFEPRAKLLNVTVTASLDETAYNVLIVFSVINIPNPLNLELVLFRIR